MSAKKWGYPCPRGPLTKHFKWQEFACHCCGRVANPDAVRATADAAEKVRLLLGGLPMHINSGCRCPDYNAAVGGEANSLHKSGFAFDFTVGHLTPRQAWEYLRDEWPGGLGRYEGFVHCDRGNRRRWRG